MGPDSCVEHYNTHFIQTKNIPKCFLKPPFCVQLEQQYQELDSKQHVTKVENVKLKQTNDELARELEHTNQELILAQEQLGVLQEQSTWLHEEKEMWVVASLTYSGFFRTPALTVWPLNCLILAYWSECRSMFLLPANSSNIIHTLYSIYT